MVYFFYYVPVGIDQKLRKVPVMTYAYTALCILLFAANKFFADSVPFDFFRLVYFPDEPNVITAVTAAFLHFGFLHLLGNLIYLFLFGRYVEDRMGAVFFTSIFIGCAGIGNLLQGIFNTYVLHDPYMGVVGASGAVSGLLGAFTIRFLSSRMEIAYWIFMPLQAFTRAGKAQMPVIFAVALWFVMQMARGLIQFGGFGGQVAYVAHLSGFALGAVSAIAAGHYAEGRTDGLLQRAIRYLRKGESYAAQGDFIHYIEDRPNDPAGYAGLARAMSMSRDGDGARRNYRKACELLLRMGRRGDCEALYQEASRGFKDFALSEKCHLTLAFGLERNLKPKLALRAYEVFVGKYPENADSPLALLRAAGICSNTFEDVEKADDFYERVIRNYPNDTWVEFAREQRQNLLAKA